MRLELRGGDIEHPAPPFHPGMHLPLGVAEYGMMTKLGEYPGQYVASHDTGTTEIQPNKPASALLAHLEGPAQEQ